MQNTKSLNTETVTWWKNHHKNCELRNMQTTAIPRKTGRIWSFSWPPLHCCMSHVTQHFSCAGGLKSLCYHVRTLQIWTYPKFDKLGLRQPMAGRPRMGSTGQNSVQAGAFLGLYLLREYLLLEKKYPWSGFPWLIKCQTLETTVKTKETNRKPWNYLEKP